MEKLSQQIVFGLVEALMVAMYLAAEPLFPDPAVYLNLGTGLLYAIGLVNLAVWKECRIITLLLLVLTAYGTSAYIAFEYFNLLYPPFPFADTIYQSTEMTIKGIFLTGLLLMLVPIRWGSWLKGCVDAFLIAVREMTLSNVLVLGGLMAMFGLINLYQCQSIGWENILSGSRREYAAMIWATRAHNYQLIAISLTIVIAVRAMVCPKRRETLWLLIPALLLYWIPFSLVGARKELMVILIIGIMIYLRLGWNKLPIYLVILVMFLFPIIRDNQVAGDAGAAAKPGLAETFHEVILPQYILFSAVQFPFTIDRTFLSASQMLVPAFLRMTPVEEVGAAFSAAALSDVSYGAFPVAEAYYYSRDFCIPVFALLTVSLMLIIYSLSRVFPGYGLIGCAWMFVWGRSEYWVHFWWILYGGFLLWAFIALSIPAKKRVQTGESLKTGMIPAG
ncbi:MAG: hypothetical protein ACM3QZ_09930 [Solirubrobacterales bacterium]